MTWDVKTDALSTVNTSTESGHLITHLIQVQNQDIALNNPVVDYSVFNKDVITTVKDLHRKVGRGSAPPTYSTEGSKSSPPMYVTWHTAQPLAQIQQQKSGNKQNLILTRSRPSSLSIKRTAYPAISPNPIHPLPHGLTSLVTTTSAHTRARRAQR